MSSFDPFFRCLPCLSGYNRKGPHGLLFPGKLASIRCISIAEVSGFARNRTDCGVLQGQIIRPFTSTASPFWSESG